MKNISINDLVLISGGKVNVDCRDALYWLFKAEKNNVRNDNCSLSDLIKLVDANNACAKLNYQDYLDSRSAARSDVWR